MGEISKLSEDVDLYDRISGRSQDARILFDLAASERDQYVQAFSSSITSISPNALG